MYLLFYKTPKVQKEPLRKFGCYFFCIFNFTEGESESHPIAFLIRLYTRVVEKSTTLL